jgi:hypothetical protein
MRGCQELKTERVYVLYVLPTNWPTRATAKTIDLDHTHADMIEASDGANATRQAVQSVMPCLQLRCAATES